MIEAEGEDWKTVYDFIYWFCSRFTYFYHGGRDKAIYEAMCVSAPMFFYKENLTWINSTPLARKYAKGEASLEEVCNHFGVHIVTPHRAMDDAKLLLNTF